MKKVLLLILLSACVSLIYAQSTCNIKKAWAFYTVTLPGVQMIDENGNPVPPKASIERFIYIEWCGSKKPEIKQVLYNNRSFSATAIKVEGRSVIVGKEFSPENKTRITATRCKKLWKIIIVPKEDDELPEGASKNIIIKTKSPGACVFKLTKETRLITLPRP